MCKKNTLLSFLALIVVTFFIFFRLGLDSVTTDDTHFKNWSYVFMKEFEQKNYDRLYVSVQPGVITTYTNILGFKFFYLLKDKLGFFQVTDKVQTDLYIHIFSKIPKSFLVLTLLILSSYLVKIMFNYQIALGFFVLMGLEPFVLGNTRVIQTDILPAFLVFIAALLLYINKNKEGYYLYPLIGFILGISNIEKASTVIILPVFIFFILFNNKNNTKRFLKLSLFVLSFLVTMIICFPSFWGNFPFTFWRIFVGSFIQGVKGQDAETFTYTMTPHIRHWYFYLRFFYNQLSEFVVIGFFIGLFVELRKISNKKYKNLAKYLFLILIPIVFFIVFQISTKKVERFMLYIFPFIILYSSVALIKLTDRYKIYNWFILTVITVRIVQFIFIFPDFLIYKNTLSMDKRYSNSYTSWGVGFYKLAKYLESTYGTDKKIYSGDYQNLRLFYTGKVLDKEILDYDSSFDFIIKTNEPERNTSILDRVILDDVFSPYEDVRFYIYRRI